MFIEILQVRLACANYTYHHVPHITSSRCFKQTANGTANHGDDENPQTAESIHSKKKQSDRKTSKLNSICQIELTYRTTFPSEAWTKIRQRYWLFQRAPIYIHFRRTKYRTEMIYVVNCLVINGYDVASLITFFSHIDLRRFVFAYLLHDAILVCFENVCVTRDYFRAIEQRFRTFASLSWRRSTCNGKPGTLFRSIVLVWDRIFEPILTVGSGIQLFTLRNRTSWNFIKTNHKSLIDNSLTMSDDIFWSVIISLKIPLSFGQFVSHWSQNSLLKITVNHRCRLNLYIISARWIMIHYYWLKSKWMKNYVSHDCDKIASNEHERNYIKSSDI